MTQIAADLVEHCRSHSNLIFANAKGDIELYADMANEACREAGLPETFLVHHGSLAKEVREDTESTMKAGRPMTTICSSTLEMGIDAVDRRVAIECKASPARITEQLQRLDDAGPDLHALATFVSPTRFRKYDDLLSEDLLAMAIAGDRLCWHDASQGPTSSDHASPDF